MFGGQDMSKMMKQMGMEVDELKSEKVEIIVGDKKLVFDDPEVKRIDSPHGEIFNIHGSYSQKAVDKGPEQEDIELVIQKTECTEEEAREALKDAEDVAEAVMELS